MSFEDALPLAMATAGILLAVIGVIAVRFSPVAGFIVACLGFGFAVMATVLAVLT